jgi:hypothetical protein
VGDFLVERPATTFFLAEERLLRCAEDQNACPTNRLAQEFKRISCGPRWLSMERFPDRWIFGLCLGAGVLP